MPEAEMDLDVKDQEEFDKLWLVEALRLVRGERRKQYGHIIHNWRRWRLMLTGILGFTPSYTQCAYIVISMKMCRELGVEHPEGDNNRDIAGFIQCLQDIKLYQEDEDATEGPAEGAPDLVDEELPEPTATPTATRASRGGRRAGTRSPKG